MFLSERFAKLMREKKQYRATQGGHEEWWYVVNYDFVDNVFLPELILNFIYKRPHTETQCGEGCSQNNIL